MVETARRREIEDVASTLFHAHGYAGTSVRDIARALDIQGASLYAHVTSKHDVLWTIVDRTATRFERAADDALATLAPDAPATVGLEALVRAHVGVVVADIGRASVFVHEWRSLAPDRREGIARRRDAYERRFRDVIAAGGFDGSCHATDPVVAAAFILTALNGLVTWYRPDGRFGPSAIADLYAELALQAVRSATSGGPTR
jgi:AcrR family transcriptional regulator